MVRLKDIAAQAGVSVMTVSKSLRGASDISAETKTRVKVLAQQMGYMPDSMAQGLRNRTTKLLGLILSTVANPDFCPHRLGHRRRRARVGLRSDPGPFLEHPRTRRSLHPPPALAPRGRTFYFPGLPAFADRADLRGTVARATPTVILGQRAPFCAQFFNVETDDLTGSYLMTRHLLELGHKKIAFLSGPSGAPWAQERLEGYRRALREADIEPDDRLIFTAGATHEGRRKSRRANDQ